MSSTALCAAVTVLFTVALHTASFAQGASATTSQTNADAAALAALGDRDVNETFAPLGALEAKVNRWVAAQ